MIRPLAASLLLALLAGASAGRPLKPEEEARIHPAGPPVSCIQVNSIRETRVRDDRTIDFYTGANQVYRNHLPHRCPELGFEERFGYETSQPQLCNVDIITVLDEGGGPTRGASCGLGSFTPITGAPR